MAKIAKTSLLIKMVVSMSYLVVPSLVDKLIL